MGIYLKHEPLALRPCPMSGDKLRDGLAGVNQAHINVFAKVNASGKPTIIFEHDVAFGDASEPTIKSKFLQDLVASHGSDVHQFSHCKDAEYASGCLNAYKISPKAATFMLLHFERCAGQSVDGGLLKQSKGDSGIGWRRGKEDAKEGQGH